MPGLVETLVGSLVDAFMASLWRGAWVPRADGAAEAGRLRRIPNMHTSFRCALAPALLAALAAGAATAPAQPPALAAASSAAAPAGSAAAKGAVDKRVIEDGKVRIEETRVRGQTQSVTVSSKLPGVQAYEVIQPPLGKDPSQDQGAAGKRTWSLFDF